jgi:hypothetical protein
MFTKYYSVDKMEKNMLEGAFNRYGGKERCIQGFGGEN